MDDFWACNVFELQKYKKQPSADELFEMAQSFMNYVKEIFPVNGVPEPIAERIRLLEERINIVEEQYIITVESVVNHIKLMSEKGELK